MSEQPTTTKTDLDELIGELAEDFAQRLQDGEKPNIDDYAAKYPQVATEIRQILPALEIMGEAPQKTGADQKQNDDGYQRGMIGEYRIIREVGRGGMGVVYEAEQLSLGRTVALKVLPFAAVLDERQIKRFRNEALAAAQLDHPNIVNVYGVGCERSVHFYTMRYVAGEPLSKVIEQLRVARSKQAIGESIEDSDPYPQTVAYRPFSLDEFSNEEEFPEGAEPHIAETNKTTPLAAISTEGTANSREYFANVARIGIEAAEALDHAHEQGVIHRDIKPANIILDARGKSWITDFGLARIETGVTMTMTGDLLGTVRYMSPEQAMAKRVIVDHRCDVYSLGVTLYELLTLTPAFPDEDRHELLRKIAFEDPKLPHKLNPKIPVELETIVLKAMAKNPIDRYATAQELADDLKRFLNHEPIRARRSSLWQQTRKWLRRHPTFSISAGVAGVVGVLALLIMSLILAEHESSARNLAEETAEKQSQLRQEAEQATDRETEQRKRAQENQQLAEANVDLALQALDEIYLRLADTQFTAGRQLQESDREFLEKAVTFYARVAEQKQNDPTALHSVAAAYHRIGRIYQRLGIQDQAQHFLSTAVDRFDALIGESTTHSPMHVEMADSLMNLAGSYKVERNDNESLAAFERAILIYQREIEQHSANHRAKRDLAWCYAHRGQLLSWIEQAEEAKDSLQHAVALNRAIVKQLPGSNWYRRELAIHLDMLASVISPNENLELAARLKEESLAEFTQLEDQAAGDEMENVYIARNLNSRANRFLYSIPDEDVEEAIHLNQERVEQWRKLIEKAPANLSYRQELVSALDQVADKMIKAHRLDEASTYLDQAEDLIPQLLEFWPNDRHTRWQQGVVRMRRGLLEWQLERFEAAEQAFLHAVDDFAAVDNRRDISWAHEQLSLMFERRGELEKAAAHLKSIYELKPTEDPHSSLSVRVTRYRGRLAGLLKRLGQTDESKRVWREMLDSLPNAAVRYRFQIDTPGSYRLFVRLAGVQGQRRISARIRECCDGPGGEIADWYHLFSLSAGKQFGVPGSAAATGVSTGWFEGQEYLPHSLEPMQWEFSKSGVYTLEILGATYGTANDRLALKIVSSVEPPRTDDLPESKQTADGTFLAANGLVVMDAIHFSDRQIEKHSQGTWIIIPNESPDSEPFKHAATKAYLQLLKGTNWNPSPLAEPFWTDEERNEQFLARMQQLIEKYPDDSAWPEARGKFYASNGQPDLAKKDLDRRFEILKKRLEQEPGSDWIKKELAQCHVDRGGQFRKRKQYHAAVAEYHKATRIDPKNWAAWRALGYAYQQNLRQFEKSVASYSKSIEGDPESYNQYTMRGRAYHALKRYDEAIKDFDRAIELRPEKGWTWKSRGTTYFSLGNYKQALADLKKGYELGDVSSLGWIGIHKMLSCPDPAFLEGMAALVDDAVQTGSTNPELHGWRATFYAGAGRTDEALKALDLFIAEHENDPDKYTPGLIAHRYNHFGGNLVAIPDVDQQIANKVVQLALKAVELEPGSYSHVAILGMAQYRAGEWQAVMESLHKAAALNSGGNLPWRGFFLAMAEHQLGNSEAAKLWYEASLKWMAKYDPENEWLISYRDEATKLLMGGDEIPDINAKSITDTEIYSLAIKAAPDVGWPYLSRGQAYFNDANNQAAVNDCTSAIERDPSLSNAWNIRGICQHRLGNLAASIADHTKAIELDPDNPILLANRGYPRMAQKDWQGAINDFQEALKHNPTFIDAVDSLAQAYEGAGDFEQAVAQWTRLIELEPKKTDHFAARAKAYRKLGDEEKALADEETVLAPFHQAVKDKPGDADSINRRGVAYFQLSRYEEAIADFTRAVQIDADNPLYRKNRANCYLDLGNWKAAEADFQRVIQQEKEYRPWYELALLQAYIGDVENYRAICGEMLQRFGNSKNNLDVEFTIWSSALSPAAFDDYKPVLPIAEKFAKDNPRVINAQQSLGGVLYRAGRTEEAVKTLLEADRLIAEQESGRFSPAYTWYLLALSHHASHQTAEAKNWLRKANEQAEQELHGESLPAWNRELTLKLLRKEAEAVIKNSAAIAEKPAT